MSGMTTYFVSFQTQNPDRVDGGGGFGQRFFEAERLTAQTVIEWRETLQIYMQSKLPEQNPQVVILNIVKLDRASRKV